MKLAIQLALVAIFCAVCGANPGFAIRTAGGEFRAYKWPPRTSTIEDDFVHATIIKIENDVFELNITAKENIVSQFFPWEPDQTWLGIPEDEIVLFPELFGVAARAASLKEWIWESAKYPGGAFSPIVVFANQRRSRIVAAVNWPPKTVEPMFSRGRACLKYSDSLSSGDSSKYRAMVGTHQSDCPSPGSSWRAAVKPYKSWLHGNMENDELRPLDYPQELREAEGWQSYYLHHYPRFDVRDLRNTYNNNRNTFPWIQIWGQMSNYHRSPNDGLTGRPNPELEPDEKTGCCVDNQEIHDRYSPHLEEFINDVKSNNGIAGLYQRPKSPYQRLDRNDDYSAFLKQWIDKNRQAGANAYYIDVYGATYLGDALPLAQALSKEFPRMSVIEHGVDLFPSAFLISGSLWGGFDWLTRPGQRPDQFDESFTRCTFPRFGRYIMSDHLIFLGGANGDFATWGDFRRSECWTERQAFLLGAKFDAPTYYKGYPENVNAVTRGVALAVDARRDVKWWTRNTDYHDYDGITNLPPGIDARVHRDKQGNTLLCIDNWNLIPNQRIRYRSVDYEVPLARLSILDIPRENN